MTTPLQSPTLQSPPTVDKSGDRVRRMFGQIAGRYDLMNHLLSLNIDRYWRWRTVQLVPPRGDEPILDVCTGTGDLALAYSKATGGQIAVTGTDFCPEMLVIAEKKAAKRNASQKQSGERVSFLEADTQQLPFADDTFQIVSVAFGLRNVSDTDAGLVEMTRVCSPGGRVAVLEFSSPRRQPLKAFYGWYFRNVLPRIGQLVARNSESAYEYLPASVGEFSQYEALAERMSSAGLRDVRFYPLTFGVATLYVGEKIAG